MISDTAIFIHSEQLGQSSYPIDNPFKTQRAAMTHDILQSMYLLAGPGRAVLPPTPATRAAAQRFHTARYFEVLDRAEQGHLDVEGLAMGLGTLECPVFKGMVDYALLACGATIAGAEQILSGSASVAFNPSGGYHHAGPEHAAGFCYLNDVVLACMELAGHGKRVVFLDLDVHHGDGVQNAFYDRSDVMTISLHESGEKLFPGTGAVSETGTGEGRGFSVNVPLPPGICDDIYFKAFREVAVPLISRFDPDVLVVEFGMDGLAGDPLADLMLTNGVYADIAGRVLQFAKPVLATGGGGYNPDNTTRGWALVWSVLCGEDHHDLNMGMGGVMLESTDWQGGLRDRVLIPSDEQRRAVEPVVNATIDEVKRLLFPLHGL